MNYHHLFYFKTIAEEGSVSAAAVKLRLGQPTLSAQLKQFEEILGVKLFHRNNRRLTLTEHGIVAFEYAKQIFRMGSEMQQVLKDQLKPHQAHLHIGALDSIPKQVILKLVQTALKENSSCQVTLSEGKVDELVRELLGHQMDLIITNFIPMGRDSHRLFPKLISKSPVGVYGSSKFKYLKKGFPQSISRQALILPTHESKLRQDVEHWAKLHQVQLHVLVESQDISVKKLMAIQGMGVIPAASYAVSLQVKHQELYLIGELEGLHEELYLVTGDRQFENPLSSHLRKKFQIY